MSEGVLERTTDGDHVAPAARARLRPRWLSPDILRGARWAAIVIWAFALANQIYFGGVPFDRTGQLFWIALGLMAASIGKRALWTVVVDFLPLALVLIAYDYLRGLSETLGMPTWWTPQLNVDRILFFGHVPTLVLQEHLKYPTVRWWDVAVCICYVSFFFLPYVTAGVLWLRHRRDFYRWSLRFVALSFLGFVLFALIPSAPPWAAAQCSAAQVAEHPAEPACINTAPTSKLHGGLLGPYHPSVPGAHPFVERIAVRGFSELHLSVARSLVEEGQGAVDPVAAVPSLHAGGTMLFVIFMWTRVRRWWRPVLASYPVLMLFSLAYSGEHYVSDQLAGWLCAALVCVVASRIERRRKRRRAPDTLESPTPETVETSCLPIQPPPETTRSSI